MMFCFCGGSELWYSVLAWLGIVDSMSMEKL